MDPTTTRRRVLFRHPHCGLANASGPYLQDLVFEAKHVTAILADAAQVIGDECCYVVVVVVAVDDDAEEAGLLSFNDVKHHLGVPSFYQFPCLSSQPSRPREILSDYPLDLNGELTSKLR